MDHVQRRLALCMAVGLGQVALNNQSMPVFHQGMAHEAQHRASAGRLLLWLPPMMQVASDHVGV
jgi:hypothetical protein